MSLNLLSRTASCKGRCGGEYYRGYTCQCDYTCLTYEECCQDYESQCTTSKAPLSSQPQGRSGASGRPGVASSARQSRILSPVLCATENSCKGRCGEAFRRGRRCSCDPDCQKFKQCCSDFQTYCDAAGERSLCSASGRIRLSTLPVLVITRGNQWSPQCYRASEEYFMP